jgi:poly(A) polymerase Pap1
VERDDFFGLLYEILSQRPDVTELNAVPDAYVPVMKMTFEGIPVLYPFSVNAASGFGLRRTVL